jgi:hypothetical protein
MRMNGVVYAVRAEELYGRSLGQPSQFCTEVCEENSSIRREPTCREDLSEEADESPLLEAVTRKRLLKTQQSGKYLAYAVVICELWRSALAL